MTAASDSTSTGGTHEGGAQVPVAQLIGETLWALGVRQVFGVVGSGNFVPTAALLGAGARYTGARHEGAAVTMADSYGRVSGDVAVCSVHQGPGLTNALTGLVDAAKSRTPMVVLAGQTSAGATRSNFYVDQVGLVECTGAIAEQVYRPDSAVADTVRAYRRAVAERRPVVLNMPLDVQAVQVPVEGSPLPGADLARRTVPTPDVVAGLAERLVVARRPLMIAGRGAVGDDTRDALVRLAERVGALLATTAIANGLFTGHPWNLGIAGGFSSDEAAALMGEADLVIGFGCSFTSWTTRHGRLFAADAHVVQIDTDPDALGLNPRVDAGIAGDAGETARALLAEVSGHTQREAPGWRDEVTVAERIRAHEASRTRSTAAPGAGVSTSGIQAAASGAGVTVSGTAHTASGAEATASSGNGPTPVSAEQGPAGPSSAAGYVHPRELSLELDALLPAERTVVVDGGHFLGWPVTCWSVPDPAGFVFTSSGFQSIGLGLAAAVGACLARPDRLTVLAAGDGGFLMSISELETLVRLRLPVLAIVYNDAAYGAEVHHFAHMYGAGSDPSEPAVVTRGGSATVGRGQMESSSHRVGAVEVGSGGAGSGRARMAASGGPAAPRPSEPGTGAMDLVRFPPTDIAALARGAGAAGVTVHDVADLGPVVTWLNDPDGPMVVDAKVDPGVVGYWAEQDFQGH